jgi:hypothetical protein
MVIGMSKSSERVRRTQELRRSNASQPHSTKEKTKQEVIKETLDEIDWESEESG